MVLPLPKWLSKPYTDLITSFGCGPFTLDGARHVLERDRAPLLLSRLKRYGWVENLQRETYRTVHPMVSLLELSGWDWRRRVLQKDRLPIVELAAASLLEELGGDLVSLVIFGSLARGEAEAGSDIDLLLVAEGLQKRYTERLDLVRRVAHSDAISAWREYLWKEKGVYPLVEIVPLTPQEAAVTQPFYLDMVDDSIVIYEKGRFMQGKLDALRARLTEVGASKVTLPSGRSYWSLAKGMEEARGLVL